MIGHSRHTRSRERKQPIGGLYTYVTHLATAFRYGIAHLAAIVVAVGMVQQLVTITLELVRSPQAPFQRVIAYPTLHAAMASWIRRTLRRWAMPLRPSAQKQQSAVQDLAATLHRSCSPNRGSSAAHYTSVKSIAVSSY